MTIGVLLLAFQDFRDFLLSNFMGGGEALKEAPCRIDV